MQYRLSTTERAALALAATIQIRLKLSCYSCCTPVHCRAAFGAFRNFLCYIVSYPSGRFLKHLP